MIVKARLFGTLGEHFPGYNFERVMDIEIPDGATVRDLLAHLEIPETQQYVVVMKGRVMKFNDVLEKGCSVQVFQSVFGG
jgi:sulfur carrier protein ThiS